MHILVTGGAGFIGTNLCRYILDHTDHTIVMVDKLTYASNQRALQQLRKDERFTFYQADITDRQKIDAVFKNDKPNAVMHLAAESHVDRSIDAPAAFMQSNIMGTYTLLEASRTYLETPKAPENFRFHHISTDEVYGSLSDVGAFTEETAYDPRSPYSASKASSDHLVRAWHHTYDLPVVISNCSNNYGPHQYPEKLIPVIIKNTVKGQPIPIYGDGQNIRDWLYIEDHCEALITVLEKARLGESYNIGGETELTNNDLVEKVCALMDELKPADKPRSYLKTYIEDRKGHDYRYAMDISKIKKDLDWSPQTSFDEGLRKTVAWYLDHEDYFWG